MDSNAYGCVVNHIKPPIILQSYYVTDFSLGIASYPDNPDVEVCVEHLKCGVNVFHNEDNPDMWMVTLELGLKEVPSDFPYLWSLSLNGLFKAVIMPKKEGHYEEIAPMIHNTGASILFSTAREYLRSATSACVCGSILLPTVSFYPADGNTAVLSRYTEIKSTEG